MLQLARALPADLRATVVTASLDVAQALRGHAGVSVDVLGGRLDRESQTLTGVATVEQLRRLRPDLCLMSPCGLDVEDGLTLRAREEAQVVAAMVERARRTIVLAGEAKLGTAGPYVVAPADARQRARDRRAARSAPRRSARLGIEVVTMTNQRAKNAVYAVFILNGFAFASWASRIPQVRDGLELNPQQLGLVLLAIAIGSLISMPLAGVVISRLGAAWTIRAMSLILAAGLTTAALGYNTGVAPVVVGLFLLGFGSGTWDVAMNVEGAEVERRIGRSIMPRFHAGFSVGTVAGALGGSAMIVLGVSVTAHLLAVAAIVAAIGDPRRARLPAGRAAPAPTRARAATRSRPGRSRARCCSACSCSAWPSPRAPASTGSASPSSTATTPRPRSAR